MSKWFLVSLFAMVLVAVAADTTVGTYRRNITDRFHELLEKQKIEELLKPNIVIKTDMEDQEYKTPLEPIVTILNKTECELTNETESCDTAEEAIIESDDASVDENPAPVDIRRHGKPFFWIGLILILMSTIILFYTLCFNAGTENYLRASSINASQHEGSYKLTIDG